MSFQADAFQGEGAYQTGFEFWVRYGQQSATWTQQAAGSDGLWADYTDQVTTWTDS